MKEKSIETYFKSECHMYIFTLIHTDGVVRTRLLGITEEHYSNHTIAYNWFKRIRDKLNACNDASLKNDVLQAMNILQKLYDVMIFCEDDENAIIPYAFVDGSYNPQTKMYGYGGFLMYDNKKYKLQGADNDSEMATMRNVAGELLGSIAAIEQALELGLSEIVIYYDYFGIEYWATGKWKRNKKYTKKYYEWFQAIKNDINVHFIKVKGHSGIEGNEEADILAKQAVGLYLYQ